MTARNFIMRQRFSRVCSLFDSDSKSIIVHTSVVPMLLLNKFVGPPTLIRQRGLLFSEQRTVLRRISRSGNGVSTSRRPGPVARQVRHQTHRSWHVAVFANLD